MCIYNPSSSMLFMVVESNRISRYTKRSKVGMRILFPVLQCSVRAAVMHFKSNGFQYPLYQF